MNELEGLQKWFKSNCNGDWEHSYGISIYTLDNPGWAVDVDLAETALELVAYLPTRVERTDQDWVWCKVENRKFMGRGGTGNLGELLLIFCQWANSSTQGPLFSSSS